MAFDIMRAVDDEEEEESAPSPLPEEAPKRSDAAAIISGIESQLAQLRAALDEMGA